MDTSPYFTSRSAVGQMFAAQLMDLRFDNTAVLALSPGGVMVGVEIAKQLHSVTGLLLLKHVYLPGGELALGVINERGGFTHDESIPASVIEDFEIEYRNSIELDKERALHDLHVIGHVGNLDPHFFKDRTVIVVTDFAKTGTAFRAAADFLKPIRVKKMVLVAAVTRVSALETMQRIGDRILIAHTTENDFPSEHYFANNIIPHNQVIMKMMQQIILQW